MSSYFNKDRNLYLSKLNSVSTTGDWAQWFEYFLNGIIYSSGEGIKKAREINDLYQRLKNDEFNKLNSAHAIQLLDFIFRHPLFNAKRVQKETGIPTRTIYSLLNKLVEMGCLSSNQAKRNTIYYCMRLVNII